MSLPDRGDINIIRHELERACKDFSYHVDLLGFVRTKKLIWVRRREWTVDVIMFHRCGSTYGAATNFKVEVRVHFAIRVLNDSFESLALNGPWSEAGRVREGRYHLSFNAKTGSMYDRCLNDLVRFVKAAGEPWFESFSKAEKLISENDTPLTPVSKALLSSAMTGETDASNLASSLTLLGLK
ncbi:hypothetical protein [Prosthecobacter sp.]|uniref:hypothetical protein n=1 Tax=Prosthecobacter sp. TaxID=1965333 RepID=UPI0037848896